METPASSVANEAKVARGPAGPAREARPDRRGLPQAQGYTWILPAFIVSVGLLYYSIGYTGYISTLDWDGSSPDPTSVGAANWLRLTRDPVVRQAVVHTVVFFLVTFLAQAVLGLVLATMLHSRAWLKGVYKVLIFVPVVLAPAIMAPVFRQIFAADGSFNWLLSHVGLGSLATPWLASTSTALPVVMIIGIWGGTGFSFILYFAALGQVDPEVVEAARIDGAGNLRVLTSILVPSVGGTTSALAVLTAIGALKTFDIPYLVSAAGPNHATEFLGTWIYTQAIPNAHVGYGAAMSVLLLLVAVLMAVLVNLRGRRSGG